jgi:hypothetical protein
MRHPQPAVPVPGETPWERLDSAVRAVFRVSKADLVKEEARETRQRIRKRAKAAKKPTSA